MIGSIFVVLESATIPDTLTVQEWGRTFVKNNLPGIIEYSDHFPGGLIRFTGPLKVKNVQHAGLKISCVEPRIFKMIILSLNLSKERLKVKHIRVLEKKPYTHTIHMTFNKGVYTVLPFKDAFFNETTKAYNLLYAEKIDAEILRKILVIKKTHTVLEKKDNATILKGYIDIQIQPDVISEENLQEYLYFIETQGIGINKDKGYGNIRLYSNN